MIIAPTLTMMAVAAPIKGEWKPAYARQQLDLQMNSTGYPFNPQFSAGEDMIVGGQIVDPPHKYPYLTSMQRNWPASPGPFCGSAIVAPNWILTAAHCTEGSTPSPNELTLLINWDDYTVTDPVQGVVRKVAAIFDHPDYVPQTLENDVSLLYVEDPVPAGQGGVSYGLLDDGTYSAVGQKGPVMGWGRIDNGNPSTFPDRPHEVEVPIWNNFRCNEPQSYPGQVTDDMICAGETGECSCNGDSGGPMVTKTATGDFITGVVSWGAGQCGAPNLPGVYARVSVFKQWIESFTMDADFSLATTKAKHTLMTPTKA